MVLYINAWFVLYPKNGLPFSEGHIFIRKQVGIPAFLTFNKKNMHKKNIHNLTTGHLINVVNFEKLLSACKSYGTEYQPASGRLAISSLEDLLSNAKDVLDTLKTQKTAYDIAVNEREIVYTDLPKLTTRIYNSLAASDVSVQTLQDANALKRKLQGRRAKAVVVEDPKAEKQDDEKLARRNTLRLQSYNRLLDNFKSLLKLLESEPNYKPKEADLKLSALQALADTMTTVNITIINVNVAYQKARIARDQVCYSKKDNLCDIGQAVKKYVRSLFGSNSPMFKQVSGIGFHKKVA